MKKLVFYIENIKWLPIMLVVMLLGIIGEILFGPKALEFIFTLFYLCFVGWFIFMIIDMIVDILLKK